MEFEGTLPILLIIAILAGLVIIVGVSIATTSEPTPTPTPTPVPTPEPTITPTPTPTPTPVPTPEPTPVGDYPNASGQQYLWDVTNNTYTLANNTPTPDIPNSIEDARARGWTGLETVEEYNYKWSVAHGLIKPRPVLSFDILDEYLRPYDFDREAVVLGSYKNVVFRIWNNGDYPYQDDIKVYANASIYYDNTKVHMENIIFEQPVSIAPHNYNEIRKFWQIGSFNGAPIPTGVYDITVELRNPDDGSTIYSTVIQIQVAKDNGGGYLSF